MYRSSSFNSLFSWIPWSQPHSIGDRWQKLLTRVSGSVISYYATGCVRLTLRHLVFGLVLVLAREVVEKFNGNREDDSRVLFGWDAIQRLKVAQLKGTGRFVDDIGRLLQSSCRLLLSLGSDHLTPNQKQTTGRRHLRHNRQLSNDSLTGFLLEHWI